jgi:hypothetical protein
VALAAVLLLPRSLQNEPAAVRPPVRPNFSQVGDRGFA